MFSCAVQLPSLNEASSSLLSRKPLQLETVNGPANRGPTEARRRSTARASEARPEEGRSIAPKRSESIAGRHSRETSRQSQLPVQPLDQGSKEPAARNASIDRREDIEAESQRRIPERVEVSTAANRGRLKPMNAGNAVRSMLAREKRETRALASANRERQRQWDEWDSERLPGETKVEWLLRTAKRGPSTSREAPKTCLLYTSPSPRDS